MADHIGWTSSMKVIHVSAILIFCQSLIFFVLQWLYVRLEKCGSLFKCLEVWKGIIAYTNLLCNKVGTIVLHYTLRMNTINLLWKCILMWNALTCQSEIDLPFSALITISVLRTKTPSIIIKWWCNVSNTMGRHHWRCTQHWWKLNQKHLHNYGRNLGRICLGNQSIHMMKWKTHPKRLLCHLNKGKQLCFLQRLEPLSI